MGRQWRVDADTDFGWQCFGSFGSRERAIEQAQKVVRTFGWRVRIYDRGRGVESAEYIEENGGEES